MQDKTEQVFNAKLFHEMLIIGSGKAMIFMPTKKKKKPMIFIQ